MKKKLRFFTILSLALLFFSCKNTVYNYLDKQSVPYSENTEIPEWKGFASDQFWWGTWQRMDNGNLYEISEDKVKVYTGTNTNPTNSYSISDTSTATSLVVTSLGTYEKKSDRIIELNNIPYFRKVGSNLDFSLKLVGFVDDRSAGSDSSRAASGVSKLRVKIRDKNHPSYVAETESDDDGIVSGKAPVAGDEMNLTITKKDDSVVVVTGLKVDFHGADIGTIPIVDEDQYALKVTGVIEEKDKTDGYLYADFAEYPLTLTITNISDVSCPPSMYEITSADNKLSVVSDDSQYGLKGTLPTIQKDGSLTIKCKVKCSGLDSTSLNTGLIVKVNSSNGLEWTDYVPLKFYKGLFPINVSAVTNAKNDSAVLNAFVIYPDNNTKFFIVDQSISGRTIFVPSFDESLPFKLVFCGATSSKVLSSSTEMFYTVAPGSVTPRVVAIPDELAEYNSIINFGEGSNKNDTEENAYSVTESFEAYIQADDIDFYKFTVSDSLIIGADRIPSDYWNNTVTGVEPIEDTNAVYNTGTMVYKGTFSSADSWVIYQFNTTSGSKYKLEWGDSDDVFSVDYNGETIKWDEGTANICVAINTTAESFSNSSTFYTYNTQTITGASGSSYAFIKVKPYNSATGTFFLRVTDSSSKGQNMYCVKSSGYVADSWQKDAFTETNQEYIYYHYLYSGYEYTLKWSDYWEGFGHSADIVVSASSVPDDFETSSKLYFKNQNSGYLEGAKINLEQDGYVFYKITPKTSYSRNIGTYAYNLIAQKPEETTFYTCALNKYDEENFICKSGSNITDWTHALIYPEGQEVVKFPVKKNTIYTVFWDDKEDGSGTRTADVDVSAYKNKELTQIYWGPADSGYSSVHTITAQADGFAYLKISNKDNANEGSFKIGVMYGPDCPIPLTEYTSHNCNFGSSIPEGIKDSDWTKEHTLSQTNLTDLFYFKTEPGTLYKLYCLNADNSDSLTGKMQGIMHRCPCIYDDDNLLRMGSNALSIYLEEAGTEYIMVQPYKQEETSLGSYKLLLVDGDNNPVPLIEYTAHSGGELKASDWLTGSITSADETVIYKYVSKPYIYANVIWDDKNTGNHNYTADIVVSFSESDEDMLTENSFDNGYEYANTVYSYTEKTKIYYIKVSAKNHSAANIGTFALAVMEGNEKSDTLERITPNSSVNFYLQEDLELTSSKSGNTYTYSVEGNYTQYKWYVDGVLQTSTTGVLSVDTSGWKKGVYEIVVEVSDGTNYCSASDFLSVE